MDSVASKRRRDASAALAPETRAAKDAINAAIELFHRRWVLRVLWELRGEPLTFRALQQACGALSPSVLSARLVELREAGLVGHDAGAGYALTPIGRELLAAMRPMTAWAIHWHRGVRGTGRGAG